MLFVPKKDKIPETLKNEHNNYCIILRKKPKKRHFIALKKDVTFCNVYFLEKGDQVCKFVIDKKSKI